MEGRYQIANLLPARITERVSSGLSLEGLIMEKSQSLDLNIGTNNYAEKAELQAKRISACAGATIISDSNKFEFISEKAKSLKEKIDLGSLRVAYGLPTEKAEEVQITLDLIATACEEVAFSADNIAYRLSTLVNTHAPIFESFYNKAGIFQGYRKSENFGNSDLSALTQKARDILADWDGEGVYATSRKVSESTAEAKYEIGAEVVWSDENTRALCPMSFRIVAVAKDAKQAKNTLYNIENMESGEVMKAPSSHTALRLK